MLPIGLLGDCFSVLLGGCFGALLSKRIHQEMKDNLMRVFGFASMTIGISSIMKLENLTFVILALVVGTILGEILHLDSALKRFVEQLLKHLKRDTQQSQLLQLPILIFCFSATAVFGLIIEASTGDPTFLLSKAILDFFTAMIFATQLGFVVSAISALQLLVFAFLFLMITLFNFTIPLVALGNFMAVGGIITFMLGFVMLKISDIKVIQSLPALLLILFFH